MIWPAVIVGSLGAYLLKLSGYVIPERVLDNPRLQRLTAILPIALLAASPKYSVSAPMGMPCRPYGTARSSISVKGSGSYCSRVSLPFE